MDMIYKNVVTTADNILSGINCTVGAAIQPITKNHLQAARDLGGDPIDLDPSKGDFVSELKELSGSQELILDYSRPYLRRIL